jgi:nucleotide-binding universal stress UspA family protein
MPLSFESTILACVDGSTYTESVTDFGVMFAGSSQTPLTLFNTVEHTHTSERKDFSGNITLGGRDELLDNLVEEERAKSKETIQAGKAILETMKARVPLSIQVALLQRHGKLYENVHDLEGRIRMLILGLSGTSHQGESRAIGEQVEEVIRALHVPILLVNRAFKVPKKVMIAYDGSQSAKKALETVVKNPLLKNVERHIVCVESSVKKAEQTLQSAQPFVSQMEGEVHVMPLEGEAVETLQRHQTVYGIDLIAMGAFSHNRLRDRLFGSFTAKMIATAKVPLLLLR